MFYIGPHLSISPAISLICEKANRLGATGFALFTKNQRQWRSTPLKEDDITSFKENLIKYNYTSDMILPHDSYLINLGTKDDEKRKKSLDSFIDELERVKQLGLKYLNFHPGSHVNLTSRDECASIIAKSLDEALSKVDDVIAVLEITAGQGSNLGCSLEELKSIIDLCDYKSRLGVCIDTCHAFQAGYDISTPKGVDEFFDHFDSLLENRLMGMHLNDSKAPCNKHLDRHESIGKGYIGLDSFLYIASNKRFENIPLILETPNEDLWESEVKMLLNASK